MNEKPILFNGAMVRAILNDNKTQTRRVIKPQPDILPGSDCVDGNWYEQNKYGDSISILDRCPYGKDGEQLWVRETWATDGVGQNGDMDFISPSSLPPNAEIHFRASIARDDKWRVAKWRPSIHMPRKLSRIQLLVKSVKVEQIQDITREDAIAEGTRKLYRCPQWIGNEPLDSFNELWESINKKRGFGWEMNPWVWVVGFERIES